MFGSSIFENETIKLNSIKDEEYDYDELDNEILDDVYSEDFYGDYDETFVPPPPAELPSEESSNPFGMKINFDDYKLSNIRDVEYEYDYEDYDYVDENEENRIETKNKELDDANILKTDIETEMETSKPTLHLKYKILKNGKPGTVSHLSPTQLYFMGIWNQLPHYTQLKRQPIPKKVDRSIFDSMISKVQGKVDFLVKAVTKKWKLPNIFG